MPLIRPHFSLLILGSSLSSNGRLSFDWTQKLQAELEQFPEAKGPIEVVNGAKGSQNSDGLLSLLAPYAALRSTHVLMETNSINDAPVTGGVPAVSIANHDANVTAAVAALRAARAGVDITLQTMNAVSAKGVALRPNLADYYARDVALAGTLGTGLLDNYNGVAGGPVGGWPKPLDPYLTNGASPWSLAPTAGFVGMDDFFGADHDASLQIFPDALTVARAAGAGTGLARSDLAHTGKTHFEFKISTTNASNTRVGIANANASLTGHVGADQWGIGLDSFGRAIRNGASLGNAGFSLTDGLTVAVEVDWAALLVYFSNGAIRSAGFPIPGTWGAAGAAVSIGGGTTTAKIVSKFTDEGDGLHPIFTGAIDTYLYPNVKAWARAKMAAYWP